MHHQSPASHNSSGGRHHRRVGGLAAPAAVATCVAALTLSRGSASCSSTAAAVIPICTGSGGFPAGFVVVGAAGSGRRRLRTIRQAATRLPPFSPIVVPRCCRSRSQTAACGRQAFASSLAAWRPISKEGAGRDRRKSVRQARLGGAGRPLCMLTAELDTGSDGGAQPTESADKARVMKGEGLVVAPGLAGEVGSGVTSTSLQQLNSMKLPELKALYREGGGKPGALRKAELVERLTRSLEGQLGEETQRETVAPTLPLEVTATAISHGGVEQREVSTPAQEAVARSKDGGVSSPRSQDGFEDRNDILPARPSAGDEEGVAEKGVLAQSRDRNASVASRGHGVAIDDCVSLSNTVVTSNGSKQSAEPTTMTVAASTTTSSNPDPLEVEAGQPRGDWPAQDGEAAMTGDDVLSRGPSAVVAAARARGAAAAAAAARVAAGGRARAMAEAKRHTEAVRSRAANGWTQLPGGRGQEDQEQSPPDGSVSGGGDGVRPSVRGGAASGRADKSRGAGVGRRARDDESMGQRVHTGRPRLMPKMPNPWSRAGRGGAAEGLPKNGDMVEEFLAETMMQASDKERYSSGDELFDRESRFEGLPGSSMQLHFLGTASCIPSTSRGVSCTVLRNEGDLWMFDVGEGTQVQIQRSTIKPTRVTKIFITHAHGDHSFGLPGMLCLMGQNYERSPGKRVEIYGPTGLRAYLRAALRYTYSKVTAPYVVHELKDVRHLHGDVVRRPDDFHLDIEQDYRFGEQRGGRDIYPDKNGHYEVFRDEKAIVRAAPMKHGVPCVGYCVEEPDRAGRLKIENISPTLNEHKEAVMKATGKKGVGWLLGTLKAMKPGDSLKLPGTDHIIHSSEAVDPPTKGRKVVILGDTCDASSMVPLAMGADVVVHEATNAYLPPLDQGKLYADVEREAIEHGHSTPVMAAAFAARVGAKTLILNHFSARYRGDASDASTAAMLRIERQALRASGFERHQVVAAWDLLQLPVLTVDQWETHRTNAREEDQRHTAAFLERALVWKQQRPDESSSTETAAGEAHEEGQAEASQAQQSATVARVPVDGVDGGVDLDDLVRNRGAHAFVAGAPSSREAGSESSKNLGHESGGGLEGHGVGARSDSPTGGENVKATMVRPGSAKCLPTLEDCPRVAQRDVTLGGRGSREGIAFGDDWRLVRGSLTGTVNGAAPEPASMMGKEEGELLMSGVVVQAGGAGGSVGSA